MKEKSSSMAILCLILGIISFFYCGTFTAVHAKKEEDKSPSEAKKSAKDPKKPEAIPPSAKKDGTENPEKEDKLSKKELLSVLSLHIRSGNIESVKKFIDDNPKFLNKRDRFGRTPLFNSVYAERYKIAAFLLKKKAKFTITDNLGNSPLHRAAQSGNPELIELLIKNGASVWSRNRKGETPLFKAASLDQVKAAEKLLKKGAHVNVWDNKGNTPLHKAADRGRKKMVEFLLMNGADTKIRNRKDKKASDLAKNEEIEKLLLGTKE